MSRVECIREAEIVSAVLAGRWPDAADPELRAHAVACVSCGDVAAVAPSLRNDFVEACRDVQVPAAGQVWWRAAVRARLEIAETAAKPITWAQGVGGAAAAGLLVALIGMAWPSMFGSLAWAATLLPRDPADARVSALLLGLARGVMPLLIIIVVCLVIAPVAVYLATSDD